MSDVAEPTVESTETVVDPSQETSYAAYRAALSGGEPDKQPATTPPVEETTPDAEQDKPSQPDNRPYRRAKAAKEQQQSSWERREAELQTEIRLLREQASGAKPAEEAKPQPAADPVEPRPGDFVSDTGEFDGAAYAKAMATYAKAEALKGVREEQARQEQARQEQERQSAVSEIVSAWNEEAGKYIEADEDIKESIAWFTSDEVAHHIPGDIQLEVLQAHPLVAHVLASDQDLMNVLFSGDVRKATKLISVLDDRVRQRVAQYQAQASAPAQGASVAETPRVPQRNSQGQFASSAATEPPQIPARPTPRGPSDVGAASADSGSGSSYKSYRERMLAKEARGEKTR